MTTNLKPRDISTLKKMADELGVPLNYFFCEDESSAELACLIAKMSEEERNKLTAQIKAAHLKNRKEN